jgi:thiopeptide-type bacteriocin biosynthesis protein
MKDWVYLKTYVGQAVERFDPLIIEVCEHLVRGDDFDRWFFLRYVDQRGLHLRVRCRARGGAFEQLNSRVVGICERALRAVLTRAPGWYRPMVLPPGWRDGARTPKGATIGIVPDNYEPELNTFGGERGMAIAEQTFEVSSVVALTVLQQEAQGSYSRKDIAAELMAEAVRAFAPEEKASAFWRRYGVYWLGGQTPVADDWHRRFVAKVQKLRADDHHVFSPLCELASEAQAVAAAWKNQLEKSAEAYRRIDVSPRVSPATLAFHFAHLMNNRLGISVLEEAYLATLLEYSDQGDRPS